MTYRAVFHLLVLALLCSLFADQSEGACAEVDSDTEAVAGKGFKLGCISCKRRSEVRGSATVEWYFRPKGEADFVHALPTLDPPTLDPSTLDPSTLDPPTLEPATGPAPTGPAHTGSAHTGSAHTGSAHTGPAHTGPAHTGAGHWTRPHWTRPHWIRPHWIRPHWTRPHWTRPHWSRPLDPPTLDPPSLDPPTLDPPTLDPPTLDPPTLDPPTLDPPTLDPPTLDPPTLDPPTLDPPTLDPPTLDPPTLDPPTLDPPTLDPPTLDPPTLDPPTLDPPTLVVTCLTLSPQIYSYTDDGGTVEHDHFMDRVDWNGSKRSMDIQDASIYLLNVTFNDSGTYRCFLNRILSYDNDFEFNIVISKVVHLTVVAKATRGTASIVSEVMMYVSIIGLQVWLLIEMIYCYRKIAAAGEEALREAANAEYLAIASESKDNMAGVQVGE
uniref:Ig-like domain-containing protein n=1 Tax=Knipowitschia caucasica TaxID=637954 RepID=A0AAV2K6R5_KNICA